MAYSKYYPEGWKNNESGATPITAGALNHMETGIKTAVDNMDNTGSNVVTYTSEDQADSAVTRSTGWTTVSALVSGMTHSNLFNSMSKMFKNIRWLYKMLGTTDISSISSAGTVTGAIAKLNTDINQTATITPASGFTFSRNSVAKSGKVVTIALAASGSMATGSWTTIGTLPSGFYNTQTAFRTTLMFNPSISGFIHVSTSGQVQVYPGANMTSLEANITLPLN